MAATAIVKPYDWPKGKSHTDIWEIVQGVITVAAGTYPAGGVPLTWNPMTAYTSGNSVYPLSQATVPDWAQAFSGTGAPFNYRILPTTGYLVINPTQTETALSATASAVAISSNVATITATNTFAAGDVVYLQGFSTTTYLNGYTVTVLSSGLSGSQFKFNFTHGNDSQSDTGTATAIHLPVGVAVPNAVVADTIIFEARFAKD